LYCAEIAHIAIRYLPDAYTHSMVPTYTLIATDPLHNPGAPGFAWRWVNSIAGMADVRAYDRWCTVEKVWVAMRVGLMWCEVG